MDRASSGNETRYLVQSLGIEPVVPPKENRLDPWPLDTELCNRRNDIERLFGRTKRFRRGQTRCAKTDLMLSSIVTATTFADQLRGANALPLGRVRNSGNASPRAAPRRAHSAPWVNPDRLSIRTDGTP
jgi:hypothetical protein